VLADNVKDARLTGFKILADAGSPLATGIVLNNAEVEIDDNEIAGAGVGIEIRGSANPIVRANSIHDSLAEGVLIVGPSTPRLAGNAIRRNKGAGIGAREGAKPVLSDNLLEKNAGDPVPGRKLR
jgi:parallel beta-helix repeat protein